MNTKMNCLLAFLVFMLSMTTTIISQDVTDGLIGYWPLDEGTDTIAADKSSSGNDGILRGDTNWVEGKFGTSLLFNGDDYVDLGDDDIFDLGTSDFTISAWIRTSNPSDQRTIFANGGDENNGIRYHLMIFDTRIKIALDDNIEKKDPSGDIEIADSMWHFIVGIRNGNLLRVYVDNVEDPGVTGHARSTLPENYSIIDTMYNAYIGCITTNSEGSTYKFKFFTGQIDDVALWNRALTEDEILELWDGGSGIPVIDPDVSSFKGLEAQREFVLKSYPNPSNSFTTISFQLPETGNAKLQVYNIFGQEVAVLVEGMRSAGIYKVQFDGSKLPDGVYFAKFQSGMYSKTIKIILAK